MSKINNKLHKSKEVILHVGHGKTGSSYLQSALATSVNNLKSVGVVYPDHFSFRRASAGHISSGNLISSDNLLNDLVDAILGCENNNVLLSYEGLFDNILSRQKAFAGALNRFNVRIILFIRDPMDHMLSAYNQTVKRGRNTHSLDQFAGGYNTPCRVAKFIEFCKEQKYELNVINYSKNKTVLLKAFERAIQIPLSTLNTPPVGCINRSLTISELEFQRLFNLHHSGQSFKFISDVLCNELPNIRPDKLALSVGASSKFIIRMNRDIKIANEKLPPHCRYSLLENSAPDQCINTDTYTFSKKQLEVIVASICKKLNAPAPREKKGPATKKPR